MTIQLSVSEFITPDTSSYTLDISEIKKKIWDTPEICISYSRWSRVNLFFSVPILAGVLLK